MPRPLSVSLAMFTAGAALLATAGFAGNSPRLRDGGIFKVAAVGPGLTMDPQVTYYTTTWSLEYATAAKLVNWSDSKIVPEVAGGYQVSKDGLTYTFRVRKGFRFSDGAKVTAKSFAYAFKRVLSPKLQSPAEQFIRDASPGGVFVTSYRAKGNYFVVKLSDPAPQFLSYMTMPFFQATSTKLPLTREVATGGIPSAGPYWVSGNDSQKATTLKRNPHYAGTRPHHLKAYTVFWSRQTQQGYADTLRNKFDEGPLPPERIRETATRFGVNKTRFWVKPGSCVALMPLNTTRGLFQGNLAMRKAFSWAVNRKVLAALSPPYAVTAWTHLLPPGFPGSVTKKSAQPYSTTPDLAKARELAHGHFKDGKIVVGYRSSGDVGPGQKDLIVKALVQLGFERSDITLRGYPGGDLYSATDWDVAVSFGWCADYPDPETFFKLLLAPGPSQVSPKYRAKILALDKLNGEARLRAAGKLDLEIMRNDAPVAVIGPSNNLFFFSNRVDPKSLVYNGVYADWDIAQLALK